MKPPQHSESALPDDADLRKKVEVLERDLAVRTASEESLRKSAAHFRALVEATSDWIWELNRDRVYVYASPKCIDLLGYTPDELLGRRPFDSMPPEEAARVAALLEPIWRKAKPFHGLENVNLHKSGRRVVLETSGVPMFDAQGNLTGYRGIDRDITERKRTEDEFRALFEHARDAIFIHDFSGRFREVNREACERLGYTREELLQMSPMDIDTPEFAALFRERSERLQQEGQGIFEAAHRRRDGTAIPVEINVRLFQLAGETLVLSVARDITERKRAAKEASARQAMLASIFRAVPTGIGIVQQRRLVEVNERVCEMTGYTRSELVGQSSRIMYPDDAEFDYVGREKYRQISERGTGMVQTRWPRKDGTVIHVLLSSTPVETGNLAGPVTFTATDITERIRAEVERRELEAQMQQAQKLESLGVLAGGIAHDFNNLLTAVLGHANLALADLAPESPGRESLQEIASAATRAGELCRQMLAYAGRGRLVVEPINLTRLIQELTHLLTVSISKKAVLSCQLAEDLPAIEGDPVQVRQVAMNLVINASEAIGDHAGRIMVSTRILECDDAWIREHRPVEAADAGRYVCLEVVDTGCGMDETVRARIFDPFYTTKFTGRGLGLAAVLGIVRKHRGMLVVASKPGDGTTFQVLFPVSEQSAAAGPSATKEEPRQGSGTILLVDDEAPVRKVATRMLERYGFTVLCAVDGVEALEVFRQHAEEIACVVLDLSMPRMDGRETLRKLREIRPRVRVLLASGYSDADVMQQFVGEGPGGFIEKPYQMDAFMAKLRSVLEAGTTSDGQP